MLYIKRWKSARYSRKINVVFKPIDFYNTDFWLFRNEREDTSEDVLDESMDQMIARGHRAIDLDLYVAVCKFDFKENERLIELGANPVYEIPEEGSYCMDRIGAECSYLEIELQGLMVYGKHRDSLAYNALGLINLVGLAAHEKMYSLLSKYDPRKNPNTLEENCQA